MSDVFVSYASDDREAARKVSEVLSAKGWSVWWTGQSQSGSNGTAS